MKAHCIVKTCLDASGSVRSRTVKVRNLDCKRLNAALEVRSYRSTEYSEHILICRLNTDNGIGTHHVRSDIKSSSASVRRYYILISLYNSLYCIYKLSIGKDGHLKTCCRLIKSLSVKVRAECYDSAILGSISLKSLKDCLGILEDSCALVKHDVCV